MHESAGTRLFDRTDQLFSLLDVVVTDNESSESELSRRAPDVLDVRLITLRVFMSDRAASDFQVNFRDMKGNSAERRLIKRFFFCHQ